MRVDLNFAKFVILTMEEKYRVIIVEDHPIFREGLKTLLSSALSVEVVGEAEDGAEAVVRAEEFKPDLVLMDLSLPRMSGVEAIKKIKERSAEIKVLALTVHMDEEYIIAAFQAGADGYVLKDANRAELVTAIETIMAGKPYLSPGISEKVIRGFLKGVKTPITESVDETLTQREREILKLVAEGYTNKMIAERLFISIKTVERHRANLMAKLDLHTPQALTAYAFERGLITR